MNDQRQEQFNALALYSKHLSVYAFRLYAYLFTMARQRNGRVIAPGTEIAKACNMSDGAVSNAKKDLIQAGLIRVIKRSGDHYTFDEIVLWEV